MIRPKHLKVISKKANAAEKPVQKPEASKGKNSLRSLAVEHQLGIVRHLARRWLPNICLFNKHWFSACTDKLPRRLLPTPPRKTDHVAFQLGEF